MNQREFIDFLKIIENLKCVTRHSWTSSGRQESVAEHSWRLAVMAMLCKSEYPELDTDKVIKMCLIHDFGEAITGDIPAFLKTEENENAEGVAVNSLLSTLPPLERTELASLFDEMNALTTPEAKLYKALDNAEAIISHNEAPLSSWIESEFDENLTYGTENCGFSPWTKALRAELKRDSLKKIEEK